MTAPGMLCLPTSQARPNVKLHVLGSSLDGRDIHMLQVSAYHAWQHGTRSTGFNACSQLVTLSAAPQLNLLVQLQQHCSAFCNTNNPPLPHAWWLLRHTQLCYAVPCSAVLSLCCQVGSQAPHKAVIWVICRQHPGEPMAEWFAEGLLERLTADTAAANTAAPAGTNAVGAVVGTEVQQLLDTAVLYIVPNMNPDGSVRWVQDLWIAAWLLLQCAISSCGLKSSMPSVCCV